MNQSIIKPGIIFYSSWGYEQTNVSFYQVISVIGKCTVAIRKLSNEKCMKNMFAFSCDVMPEKDKFIGESIRKRVSDGGGGPSLKICDSERAYLWDGRPKFTSSYA